MELRERLFELRKHILDKTMDEFGKRVGLSKQAISQVESGKSNLSDVAIKAICREYGVREEWLRTGSGDIFVKKTIEDELTDLAEKVMADTPDSFRRRFVTMLAKLTDDQWKLLSEMESMLLSSDAGSDKDSAAQLHADLDHEIALQKKQAARSTGSDFMPASNIQKNGGKESAS